MKIIYCVFIFGFVAVQAYSAEDKEKIKAIYEECRAESGVTDETLQKVRRGESVDDPKLKENAFCFLKKTKLINEAGEFQKTTIKNKFTAEIGEVKAEDVVKKCAVEKSTPQESAHDFLLCIRKQKKQ